MRVTTYVFVEKKEKLSLNFPQDPFYLELSNLQFLLYLTLNDKNYSVKK